MQMSASLLRWFWILKLFDKRSGGVRYGNLIAFPNLLRKTRTSEQFDSFFLFLFYRIATRVLNPWIRVQPDRQKFFAMRIERFFFLSLFSFLLWRRTWRRCWYKIFFIHSNLNLLIYFFFFFFYNSRVFSPLVFIPPEIEGRICLIIWIARSVILNLVVSVYYVSKTRNEPCLKFDGFSVTTLLLRYNVGISPKLWEKLRKRGGGEGGGWRAVVGKPCTPHDLFVLETEGPAIREGKYFLDGLGPVCRAPPTLWLSP